MVRSALGPLLLCLSVALCHAQTQISCNITEVKVEQFSNAVEIHLKADGLLTVTGKRRDFVGGNALRDDIPVRITNARSVIGTFADVSTYPINYVELLTPPESREGVGLDVRVVLFGNARMRRIDVDGLNEQGWYSGWGLAFDVRKSASRRDLVITVWSDRHEEVRDLPKPRRDADLPVTLDIEDAGDGLMNVDAVNAPLEELMGEVSQVAGVPILVDDHVKRLATVRMTGVSLDRLVGAVANGYGLTATMREGIWQISDGLPRSIAPYVAARTRTFALKYLEAGAAMNLLPNFLVYYVRPTASGDALVAHGPEQLLDRIGEDLEVLDKPVRMVAVRTAVVEATDQVASERLWRLLRGGRTRLTFDPSAGSIGIGHGDRTLEKYVASIRALTARGRLSVEVHPTLVVYPGAWGSVFVGERQYYQYIRNEWEDMRLGSTEAGLRLHCRPRPTGSGMIETVVWVEVSTLRTLARDLPIRDRRMAYGTMLTGSGDTMVIGGGLVFDQDVAERRAPWARGGPGPLSLIPEARAKFQQMREIVFLVSSEIVTGKLPVEATLPLEPAEG